MSKSRNITDSHFKRTVIILGMLESGKKNMDVVNQCVDMRLNASIGSCLRLAIKLYPKLVIGSAVFYRGVGLLFTYLDPV